MKAWKEKRRVISNIWIGSSNGFYYLWVFKFCLIVAKDVEADKFIELWHTKTSFLLVVGKLGFGLGHCFGIKL